MSRYRNMNAVRTTVRPRTRTPHPALDLRVTIIEEDEPSPEYLALMRRLIFGDTTPPLRPDEGRILAWK